MLHHGVYKPVVFFMLEWRFEGARGFALLEALVGVKLETMIAHTDVRHDL